jgi:hypothetical protein
MVLAPSLAAPHRHEEPGATVALRDETVVGTGVDPVTSRFSGEYRGVCQYP